MSFTYQDLGLVTGALDAEATRVLVKALRDKKATPQTYLDAAELAARLLEAARFWNHEAARLRDVARPRYRKGSEVA